MRDGMTAKMERPLAGRSFDDFSRQFNVRLVLLNSEAAGRELPIVTGRVTLGRGPGVDYAFDDTAMSRQHAAIEFDEGGFRVSDLGSTNGMEINGRTAGDGEIGHGDRFGLGNLEFQLVIDATDDEPEVYEISAD